MFFVRFLLLLLLSSVGFMFGHVPTQELNSIGTALAFSFLVTGPCLYLLPTYEASRNKHPDVMAIFLVNLFLGWIVIGWIVAVIWAHKKPLSVAAAQPANQAPAVKRAPKKMKKCPYCAEEVLIEAVKCKHCGSSL